MMKKVIALFVLFGMALSISSCDLDDGQNFNFTTLRVVEAQMPAFFELNETYDIEVTYQRPNGCTFFEGFDVTKTGDTDRDVVVIGTEILDGNTACTQAIEEVTAILKFNVIFNAEYHFRFYAGNDGEGNATYIEYTVPVN
ncbi:hypothetical protein [Flagellimonas sp. S3867]|uniref:hypothetical protein n=1 Tax=Flagellimonas sp. S3867 TaxID=2768063 RepID=UPI001CC22590|nr:hypothetical protein [Flagellimonas sp. S3867]